MEQHATAWAAELRHHIDAVTSILDQKYREIIAEKEELERSRRGVDDQVHGMKDLALRDLQAERNRLDRERAALDREKEEMKKLGRVQESTVKLNVGGHYFTTSTETLTRVPDSKLAAMFSGRYPLKKGQDDAFFIDRDGHQFRHILNFLRSRQIPEDPQVRRELLDEAQYYNIAELVDILSGRGSARPTPIRTDSMSGAEGPISPGRFRADSGYSQPLSNSGSVSGVAGGMGSMGSPTSGSILQQHRLSNASLSLSDAGPRYSDASQPGNLQPPGSPVSSAAGGGGGGGSGGSFPIGEWQKAKCSVRTITGHTDSVNCLKFENNTLVTGSRDNTIRVWDWTTGECQHTLIGHTDCVECVQFNQNILVSGGRDNIATIWNLNSGGCLHKLKGHTNRISCLQFSGNTLVTGSFDNTIRMWDMTTGQCIHKLEGHTRWVNCLQFHGNILVSGSRDNTLRVWDLSTGKCQRTLTGHTGAVGCLTMQGNVLISGSNDNTIRVWDVSTGMCQQTLLGHTGWVLCLQLTGNILASGSKDNNVRIWDLASGQCARICTGHTRPVLCLQFRDNTLVTGSSDYTIRIWDMATGQCQRTLTGTTDAVTCLQFENNNIISGSSDKVVRCWEFTPLTFSRRTFSPPSGSFLENAARGSLSPTGAAAAAAAAAGGPPFDSVSQSGSFRDSSPSRRQTSFADQQYVGRGSTFEGSTASGAHSPRSGFDDGADRRLSGAGQQQYGGYPGTEPSGGFDSGRSPSGSQARGSSIFGGSYRGSSPSQPSPLNPQGGDGWRDGSPSRGSRMF